LIKPNLCRQVSPCKNIFEDIFKFETVYILQVAA